MIEGSIRRTLEVMAGTDLEPLLREADLLVPVPRRAPLVKGALWVGERIAQGLLDRGIG